MPSRRRSRQRALQILFLWDARRQPVDEAIDAYYDTLYSEEQPARDPFVADLVRGTVEHLAEVDERSRNTPSTGAWSACPPWTATFCAWRSTR